MQSAPCHVSLAVLVVFLAVTATSSKFRGRNMSSLYPLYRQDTPRTLYTQYYGEMLKISCSVPLRLVPEGVSCRAKSAPWIENKYLDCDDGFYSNGVRFIIEALRPHHIGQYECRTMDDHGNDSSAPFNITGKYRIPEVRVDYSGPMVNGTVSERSREVYFLGNVSSSDRGTIAARCAPTAVDPKYNPQGQVSWSYDNYTHDSELQPEIQISSAELPAKSKDRNVLSADILSVAGASLSHAPHQFTCTAGYKAINETYSLTMLSGAEPDIQLLSSAEDQDGTKTSHRFLMAVTGSPLGSFKACFSVPGSHSCTKYLNPLLDHNLSMKSFNALDVSIVWTPPTVSGCAASLFGQIDVPEAEPDLAHAGHFKLVVHNPWSGDDPTNHSTRHHYHLGVNNDLTEEQVGSGCEPIRLPMTVPPATTTVRNTSLLNLAPPASGTMAAAGSSPGMQTVASPSSTSTAAGNALQSGLSSDVTLVTALSLSIVIGTSALVAFIRIVRSREARRKEHDHRSHHETSGGDSLQLHIVPMDSPRHGNSLSPAGDDLAVAELIGEFLVDIENVCIAEEVGQGAFAVVHRGVVQDLERGQHCSEVALKCARDESQLSSVAELGTEIQALIELGRKAHPNVLGLLGVCLTNSSPIIILEYASRGDLLTLLRERRGESERVKRRLKCLDNITSDGTFSSSVNKEQQPSLPHACTAMPKANDLIRPEDVFRFSRQIAKGMEFLASRHVIHRDLAARNILVTSNFTLKISDFGHSRVVESTEGIYQCSNNKHFPVKWHAIESLQRGTCTTSSDVWSFGVVLWEIATLGCSPYPGMETGHLLASLRAGYRMAQPPNCSDELYGIMVDCWQQEPSDRPTFTELVEDVADALEDVAKMTRGVEYISLGGELQPSPSPVHDHAQTGVTVSDNGTHSTAEKVALPSERRDSRAANANGQADSGEGTAQNAAEERVQSDDGLATELTVDDEQMSPGIENATHGSHRNTVKEQSDDDTGQC